MVYLKDLKTQWPWNPNAAIGDDKMIFTENVDKEDASVTWRIPIEPPSHGYVYVGFRIVVDDMPDDYIMHSPVVIGYSVNRLFEEPFGGMTSRNREWTPFVFPLTHRMIAIDPEGLDICVNHMNRRSGGVEMLVQRLDDFVEDESKMNYTFLDETNTPIRLMTPKGQFYRPAFKDIGTWKQPVKIIPPLKRVLNKEFPDWPDTEKSWNSLELSKTVDIV